MTTIAVQTPAQARQVLAVVRSTLSDFNSAHRRRGYWDRLSEKTQKAQEAWFRGGLGGRSGRVSRSTERARRERAGYYQNPRAAGVRPDRPKYVWTGLMRKSTTVILDKRALSASIDTARNYAGPLPYRDPVETILVQEAGLDPWDLSRNNRTGMTAAIEGTLEEWVQEEVIPFVASSV